MPDVNFSIATLQRTNFKDHIADPDPFSGKTLCGILWDNIHDAEPAESKNLCPKCARRAVHYHPKEAD